MLVVAAAGAALFAASNNFLILLTARALIGLGVAAALTAGLKALVLWFPRDRVPLLNGLMIMFAALGAVTATLPAEALLVSVGWRGLFELLALGSAGCALMIYLVVPEVMRELPVGGPAADGLRTVYADPRFWRLAPLSATCIGTAWALQGLWAAPWFSDVEGLDRPALLRGLFVMAIALSFGALLLALAADRLRRRGVGPQAVLGLVATPFHRGAASAHLSIAPAIIRSLDCHRRCRRGNNPQLRHPGGVLSQRACGTSQRGTERLSHRVRVCLANFDRRDRSAVVACRRSLSRNRVPDRLCSQRWSADLSWDLVRCCRWQEATTRSPSRAGSVRSSSCPPGPGVREGSVKTWFGELRS